MGGRRRRNRDLQLVYALDGVYDGERVHCAALEPNRTDLGTDPELFFPGQARNNQPKDSSGHHLRRHRRSFDNRLQKLIRKQRAKSKILQPDFTTPAKSYLPAAASATRGE